MNKEEKFLKNKKIWEGAEVQLNNDKGCVLLSDLLKEYANQKPDDFPKVICICGSTRFADQHAIKRWELEQQGHIGLMINYLPGWYAKQEFGEGVNDHFGEKSGNKEFLDELHFRKIDMSDEIFVINVDGYIGESTRNEIDYARKHNKPVVYLEKGECPECMQRVGQDELDVFGGLCESCTVND